MNLFPRHSLFQGHLISAIPNRYLCSECHSILIYACGDETETLTCAKDSKHTGLVNKDDIDIMPTVIHYTRQQHLLGIHFLFGDNE